MVRGSLKFVKDLFLIRFHSATERQRHRQPWRVLLTCSTTLIQSQRLCCVYRSLRLHGACRCDVHVICWLLTWFCRRSLTLTTHPGSWQPVAVRLSLIGSAWMTMRLKIASYADGQLAGATTSTCRVGINLNCSLAAHCRAAYILPP